MGKSLQDQFLKMGLVDKKKYNKSKKEAHNKRKTKGDQKDEIKEAVKKGLAEKKQKDLQHNKKKRAEREKKEATAQARQLIETHKIPYDEGNVLYNFKDNNTIKKLYFTEKIIEKLAAGKIGIVKLAGVYQLVPADTIYKLKELNDKMVVLLNTPNNKKETDSEDPYAGYEVPDDLMW